MLSKWYYLVLSLLILSVLGLASLAFGTNNPQVFGHSMGEIDLEGLDLSNVKTNGFITITPFEDDSAKFGTGEGKIWYRGTGGTSNAAPENSLVVVGNNLYVHNGDVKTNQFLQMYSWPEHGTGDAKLWYDGTGGEGDAKGTLHLTIQGEDNIQFDEDGNIESAGSVLATPIMGQ